MGSVRLLPLLAENLKRLGVEDPSFGAYRGVQRRTWARNHMLNHGAATVLRKFHDAGIPILALKGIVLTSTCYESVSLRPMGDLDFLVKGVDRMRALDQMERFGWRLQVGNIRPRDAADFAIRPSCVFEDPANPEVSVDLHWRLLWAQHSDKADAALWERADPFEIGGEQCSAPCTADMLLHICVHGAKWNPVPPLRWIVDAVLLLRSGGVNWAHLCAQSARLRLNLPLADTLQYLRAEMRAPIPKDVLDSLANEDMRPIERLLYETELHPPQVRGLLTTLRIHWHVAHSQLAHSSRPYDYWRYFLALRAGRSLGEITAWTQRRLIDGGTR
jgi:hypothetical protein